MELIPVLDLMGGAVVHARRGERDNYRPILTPLCEGAEPIAIAGALLELAPFRTLYIADLDAIAGKAGHDDVISRLKGRFSEVDIWVDAGEADEVALTRRRAAEQGLPVVGTETMKSFATGLVALESGPAVLSLDYGPEGARGPAEFHSQAEHWPEAVIVMTLARVGGGEGPDYERLADVIARAGERRVYAAGGVRTVDDLQRLADLGTAGVLIASALHDGRLGHDDLARFMI